MDYYEHYRHAFDYDFLDADEEYRQQREAEEQQYYDEVIAPKLDEEPPF